MPEGYNESMIIHDIDDLELDHDDDTGLEEVGRKVLSRGPWTTVAFLIRTRRGPEEDWEGPFLWLHRYQKVAQGWKLVSRFHTTERAQLDALLGALKAWNLV
jgi:lipopolysaccharide biosynthesis protein